MGVEIWECPCIDIHVETLWWRHNDHDSVSNHQPHECLFNRLFRPRSKKTSKLRVTGLCVGNSPGPVNSPHKGPVTRKMFPFDDVIMEPLNCEKTNTPIHRNLLAVLLGIVVLLIWSLGKQSRQILIKIYRFWHKISAKWRLFCLVLNVLTAMFSVMSQCHLIFRHAGQTGEGCGASGLGQGTGLVRKEGRVWYSGEHTQGSFWACYMYVAYQFIARAQTLVEFVRMFVIKVFLHRCNYFVCHLLLVYATGLVCLLLS